MTDAPRLPAELSLPTVAQVRGDLLAWLDAAPADGPLRVDAQRVDEVDAAGVQLLLSLAASLAARGRSLRLVAPSAPLVSACQALGAGGLVTDQEPS